MSLAVPEKPNQNPHEEAAIQRATTSRLQAEKKVSEIDIALDRARERRAAYRAAGAERDVEIQDAVIDRNLRERFQITKGLW